MTVFSGFLSLLVSIAMLFSGAYTQADPAAAYATTTTVGDVVFTANGETYALDLAASMGVATEDGSALLDFALESAGDTLFPVQVGIDESGISLLPGQAGRVYILPAELISDAVGQLELDEGTIRIFDAYGRLLRAAVRMQSISEEDAAALTEQLNAYLADKQTQEAATFELDGEVLEGTRTTIVLDNAEYLGMIDLVAAQEPSGFMDAYFAFLNAILQEIDPQMPELHNFSDLMAAFNQEDMGLGLTLGLTLDMQSAGDKAVGDVTVHLSVLDGEEGEMALDIPLHCILRGEKNLEISSAYEIRDAETAIPVQMHETVVNDDVHLDLSVDADSVSVALVLDTAKEDSGSVSTVAVMTFKDEADTFVAEMNGETAPDQTGSKRFAFSVTNGANAYALSFTVSTRHGAIENRMEGAERIVFDSVEDETAAASLLGDVMAMAGDAEKLMNNESLLSLAENFAFLPGSMRVLDGDLPVPESPDDWESYEAEEPYVDFTWLPGDYEISEVEALEDGSVSVLLESAGGSGAPLSLRLEDHTGTHYQVYHLKEDGSISFSFEPIVYIARNENGVNAVFEDSGFGATLETASVALEDAEVCRLFASLVY